MSIYFSRYLPTITVCINLKILSKLRFVLNTFLKLFNIKTFYCDINPITLQLLSEMFVWSRNHDDCHFFYEILNGIGTHHARDRFWRRIKKHLPIGTPNLKIHDLFLIRPSRTLIGSRYVKRDCCIQLFPQRLLHSVVFARRF